MFEEMLYVPKDKEIKKEILEEVHYALYAEHSCGIKIYRDIHNIFWWREMKKEISLFVEK